MERPASDLPAPTLVAPIGGADVDEAAPTLQWEAAPGADGYDVQVARERGFNQLLFDERLENETSLVLEGLPEQEGVTLFWRVRGRQGGEAGSFSEAERFRMADWVAEPAPAAVETEEAGRQSRRDWTLIIGAVVVSFLAIAIPFLLFTDIDLGASYDDAAGEPDSAAAAGAPDINVDSYGVVGDGAYSIPIDSAMNAMLRERGGSRGAVPQDSLGSDSFGVGEPLR